nr:folylpolyglutamate synthase/dihydrofolate synthase family protein [uncultured Faecalimonas sp.]
MDYQESIKYILDIPKFTVKNHLTHTKEFLERLGNPQNGRKVIHVAGTNGKGSVCAYIQALLLAEEKTTGFFSSPHLVKMNERIQINGKQIDDQTFLSVFEKVKHTVDEMEKDGLAHPTFFEFLFGMAMTAFAWAETEYVVLETGLGGRLDATNAVDDPVLTVITSIGFDHTEILGDTIEKIAAEKGGIIKPQVPLVFDGNQSQAAAVLRQIAEKYDAPCREITKDAYEIQEITDKYIAFSKRNAYDEDVTWKLSNTGCYQADNALLALEAVSLLLPERHKKLWADALFHVKWPGRMEEILPGVYIDGAHNQSAVERFVETVKRRPACNGRTVILFSAVREKAYEEMIATLCRNLKVDSYVITTVESTRKADAGELARIVRNYTDSEVIVREQLEEAWAEMMRQKGEDGIAYCLGSLYLVGMIKELVKGEPSC